MFLLNYFPSKFMACPLLFQLMTLLLLLVNVLGFHMSLHLYTMMPVTARSQTKASKCSSSYTEFSNLPTNTSSLMDSLVKLLNVYAAGSSTLILPPPTSSSIHHVSLQPTLHNYSLYSSSLDFQNSDHFEISNIPNFNSELTIKSACSNILRMEADYEESGKSQPSSSSAPVDIEKLFTVFTHQMTNQISTQTNSLQDEIRDNELRIMQDNDDFKHEMREDFNELRHHLQNQPSSLPSTIPLVGSNQSLPIPVLSSAQVGNVFNASPFGGRMIFILMLFLQSLIFTPYLIQRHLFLPTLCVDM